MKTKRIYLIRHGETEYNRQGIVQGSGIDADLNAIGQAQAKAFFESYQYVPFDKIYTSTLKRTQQSVVDFLELGIPHEKLSGLDEICWGIKEGKKPNKDDDGDFTALMEAWRLGQTHVAPKGGESPDQVVQRQQKAIQYILSKPEEELVLVAMHGRAMRILLAHLTNKPLASMDDFEHSNLCLYELTYSYDNQSFSIENANDTSHLILLTV